MAKRNKKYNGIRTITPRTKKSENTNGFSPSKMGVFEVIEHFKTNTEKGLTTQSIQKRRKKEGLNLLYSEFKRTFSSAFIDHIKAVVSVLLASSLFLFFAFYKNYFYLISAIIITVSILFDCVLEHIASLKFEKVRKHASLKAVVKRNGRVYVTDSRYLVPGDLVFLQQGAIVPADLRLFESNGLIVLETPITGSDEQIKKIAKDIGSEEENTFVNMTFAGSIVTSGNAWGIVCFTGAKTKFRSSSSNRTGNIPRIFKYVYSVASMLSICSAFLGMVWIVLSMIFTSSLTSSFLISIAVASCSFSDALVSLSAFSYSLGLSEMKKNGAILRNLSSIEALAFTDSLLVSQNTVFPVLKTEVDSVYLGLNSVEDSEEERELIKYFLICSDVKKVFSNEKSKNSRFEGKQNAVSVATYGEDKGVSLDDLSKEFLVTETYDRENEDYFSALAFDGDKKYLFIKGSPLEILPLCKYHKTVYGIKDMSENDYTNYCTFVDSNTNDAGYLIAIASIETEIDKINDYDDNRVLTLCGMVKFTTYFGINYFDEVSKCRENGIEVSMLSSDTYMRAYNLGKNSGIFSNNGQVITAEEMKYVSASEFEKTYSDYRLFMDFSPDLCNKIVELNKKDNRCIAISAESTTDLLMMKNADVSFARAGESSDMIKQASDVILSKGGFDIINSVICSSKKIYRRIHSLCEYAVYNYIALFLIFLFNSIFDFGIRFYDFLIASFVFSSSIALFIASVSIPNKRKFDVPSKRKGGVSFDKFGYSLICGVECAILCSVTCLFSGDGAPIMFLGLFSSFSVLTAISILNEQKIMKSPIIGFNFHLVFTILAILLMMVCLIAVPSISLNMGYSIFSPVVILVSLLLPAVLFIVKYIVMSFKRK